MNAVAGVVLRIAWMIFVRTTWESIESISLILATAFLGALIWALLDSDLLSRESVSPVVRLMLIAMALVPAPGMSWGSMPRRASGQVDIDDVSN